MRQISTGSRCRSEPKPQTARPRGRFSGIGDFGLFAGMQATSIAELAAGIHLRRWPARSVIFTRDDPGDHMLAVISGRVRLSLSSARGGEITLGTLGPGDILGEMALIDGQPRSANATAQSATSCLVLPRATFEAVAMRHPDVGLALARHLSLLLRSTNFQMESIALYDLQTRLVRFLLHAIDRSGQTGPMPQFVLGLSQGEIAAILGATRPRVSTAFNSLLACQILRRDGDTLICDRAALAALAEGG